MSPMWSPKRYGAFLIPIVVAGLVSTVRAQTPAPRGEKYALLVGVRRYEANELRELSFSESDVVGVSKVLLANGYRAENVVLMTQSTGAENLNMLPTAARIRKELELLVGDRTPGDTVVVGFAGHGVQFNSETEMACP
jgi:hypothetical protein